MVQRYKLREDIARYKRGAAYHQMTASDSKISFGVTSYLCDYQLVMLWRDTSDSKFEKTK